MNLTCRVRWHFTFFPTVKSLSKLIQIVALIQKPGHSQPVVFDSNSVWLIQSNMDPLIFLNQLVEHASKQWQFNKRYKGDSADAFRFFVHMKM